MKPLAKPITDMNARYEVVVVGSGYGGSIAASRMARCGLSVCLLERGKEILTGDYPDSIREASGEFQLDAKGLRTGSPTGLYDLRLNDDINVFIGCGLGGTSLVNANVSLRADDRVLEDPRWPPGVHDDPRLALGYERARKMLAPNDYPNHEPLNKLKALQTSAAALGTSADLTPINVNFAADAVNHANVVQPACTLCGDCCSGCNVGAKNTTLVNYLPDAANHGAEIFTEVKVRRVGKAGSGWNLFFQPQSLGRDGFEAPEMFVSADIVILAAGTLGSSEILLRSKAAGLALSDLLGQRFTGNGDVLAFGYNNDVPIDGVGVGEPPKEDKAPVGPCITGCIDLRDSEAVADGMIIEEGSLPSALAPILPALMAPAGALFGEDTDGGLLDYLEEKARVLTSMAKGAYSGAVNHTQTFLVMSHDDGAGEMRLEDDRLAVHWPGVADQPIFEAVERRLHRSVEALGGTYVRNPMSETLLGNNLITVHPLGGCIMGSDSDHGVVNHKAQVFDPSAPGGLHDGLYVCDGAILPSPLGVNPLFTISALAERAMDYLAEDRGLALDVEASAGAAPRQAGPAARAARNAGLQFTERMAGFISGETTGDYEAAAEAGREADSPCSFVFTVIIHDVKSFIEDPEHAAALVGTVIAPTLSDHPLTALEGSFNLFVDDPDDPRQKRMKYASKLVAEDGRAYRFEGFKTIRDDPGFDVWEDTTTLYVDIYEIGSGEERLLGKGILKIAIPDFVRQMTTLKALYGRSKIERLEAVAAFGKLFAGALWESYGHLAGGR